MSKSPSLRRIQADVRELALDPSDRYHAAPLEHDMFEWHFTIRGAEGTDFEGGVYHGRILLPPEYPFKPPHILFLTPSGRFETHQKVCLSFSAYHPELWQPAWGIRLILEALIAFLPTPADGAIGSLDWTPAERKRLAKKSQDFKCPVCGPIKELLPERCTACDDDKAKKPSRFAKEIEKLQLLQQANEAKNKNKKDESTDESKPAAAADDKMDTPPASANRDDGEKSKEGDEKAKVDAGDDEKEAEIGAEEKADGGMEPALRPESESNAKADDAGEVAGPTTAAGSSPTEADSDSAPATPAAETAPRGGAAPAADAIPPPPPTDPSWMIDPLLNLMVALMAVICFLLYQKCNALWTELEQLQSMEAAEEAAMADVIMDAEMDFEEVDMT